MAKYFMPQSILLCDESQAKSGIGNTGVHPRAYARRNFALKSYMTILHCLENAICLELLG